MCSSGTEEIQNLAAGDATQSSTLAVPPGWIYEPNEDNSARLSLGTTGSNPLICFGVNPSTAVPGDLDQTLKRVQGYAARNQFDSWLMFNLYPQRSTDPDEMHSAYVPVLKAQNEKRIAEYINGRPLTLLAAWGDLILHRPYLSKMLADIVRITDASSCNWISIGGLTAKGHPRHPSRGAYAPFQPFDMKAYLQRL
ncbi:DUF1643 domain-containing protein [Microbacterium esteraromaticum]|nr:DUF1643 domain-containing protein [Microbacterium esteraromaticum]WDH80097.1 DUF1643 domain-containing protein [Microbacterium esteraromaticum]